MKLYVLFAQYKESYPGELAPDALEAVTEFQVEDNSNLMPDLLSEHSKKLEYQGIAALGWISLEVDSDAIRGRLLPVERPLKAKVLSEDVP